MCSSKLFSTFFIFVYSGRDVWHVRLLSQWLPLHGTQLPPPPPIHVITHPTPSQYRCFPFVVSRKPSKGNRTNENNKNPNRKYAFWSNLTNNATTEYSEYSKTKQKNIKYICTIHMQCVQYMFVKYTRLVNTPE